MDDSRDSLARAASRATARAFARSLALLVLTAGCDGSLGVHGRVLDGDGEPVGGAELRLGRPGEEAGFEAVTAPDGCFSLGGLVSPGERDYLLTVSAAGAKPFEGTFRSSNEYAGLIHLAPRASRLEGGFEPLDPQGLLPELEPCAWLLSIGSNPGDSFLEGPSPPAPPPPGRFAGGWRCTNDVEVRCADGACESETGDAFTPMSVDADEAGALSVCAYSGCWEGTADIIESGEFLILIGRHLEFSTSPDSETGRADIILTIDRNDGVGTLKAEEFALPLLCRSLADES